VVLNTHIKRDNYSKVNYDIRKQLAVGDVLIISPRVGETRPCRVRAPLIKYLNRAKVVAVAVTLVHHIETTVVVESASMTNM